MERNEILQVLQTLLTFSFLKVNNMIESFEFEGIRLSAPKPSGVTGQTILRGNGSIDEQEMRTFSELTNKSESLSMDTQRLKVFQTRIGTLKETDSHAASDVVNRVAIHGALAPGYTEPKTQYDVKKTSSEILSSFLDEKMSYVPPTSEHVMPSFTVDAPRRPYLNPGITLMDKHKVNVNWV